MADGAPQIGATVRLAKCLPSEVVSLIARRGAEAALAAKVLEQLGTGLPDGPHRREAEGLSILGLGPHRWLIVRDGADPEFQPRLAIDLEGLGAVCLQTDAYSLFQIGGPKARDALAKGVPIDLHPSAFGLTSAAVTSVAHVGVILWQVDEAPTYRLAVYRSYERGFWRWLCESAVEFGFCCDNEDAA